MSHKFSKVKVILTGKVIAVKSYGFGFIDAAGNLYKKNEIEFLEVVE